MSEVVTVETTTAVRVITMNRPDKRNAVNGEMSAALARAFDDLDAATDVAVGVLTGAGGTFCAGMDLVSFAAGDSAEVPGRGLGGITSRVPSKPVVAAVEGYALAGGLELALACDVLAASRVYSTVCAQPARTWPGSA